MTIGRAWGSPGSSSVHLLAPKDGSANTRQEVHARTATGTSTTGTGNELEQGIARQVRAYNMQLLAAKQKYLADIKALLDRNDKSGVTQALLQEGVLQQMLRGQYQDTRPGVQHAALLCIAQLTSQDPRVAQQICDAGSVAAVCEVLDGANVQLRVAACNVLAEVAKRGVACATEIQLAGAVDRLIHLLQSLDTELCVASAAVLRSMIAQDEPTARDVLDDRLPVACAHVLARHGVPPAVPTAIAGLVSAGVAHGPVLAARFVNGGCVAELAAHVRAESTPSSCKAHVCVALKGIAEQSDELAAEVAKTAIWRPLVAALGEVSSPQLRLAAAKLLLPLVQRTPANAETLEQEGVVLGLAAFLQLDMQREGAGAVGLSIVGYLVEAWPSMAEAFYSARVCEELISTAEFGPPQVAAVAAWALHHLAAASPSVATNMGDDGAVQGLLNMAAKASRVREEPAAATALNAAAAIASNCERLSPLHRFVDKGVPRGVLLAVLAKARQLLRHDLKGRQEFVTQGAMHRLQLLGHDEDDDVALLRDQCNELFPQSMVEFYK